MSDTRAIANQYGLHPLHPACVEIASLREAVAELKHQLGRPFVVERGPWYASEDGDSISSDDFTHDVRLEIFGDFGDGKRKEYADELARRLNASVSVSADVGA